VAVASADSLAVAADNGDDILEITVFNGRAPTVFLEGEDAAPKRFGDELGGRHGSGRAGYHDVTGHAFGDCTVVARYRNAFTGRIDYTRIEGVRTCK
jgi:hypothetical protein